MRRMLLAMMVVGAATTVWADSGGSEELRILSFPIGLIAGEVPVDVDLGPSRAPADLYLDGTKVCALSAASTRCMVDLGEDLHVHLLELVRRNPDGGAAERAARWVNRPGQEAEAAILLARRSADGICGGRLVFSHPAKQTPVKVSAEDNGRGLLIGDDGRSFRYPCPDTGVPHLITASAVFADGARAEAVTLAGGFGSSTDAGLASVALVDDGASGRDCGALAASLGPQVTSAGDTGFEVVFVLDPRARFRKLADSGRDTMMAGGRRFGSPHPTWRRAFATLHSSAGLWYVRPDAILSRVNGFGQGRERWLDELFAIGAQGIDGDLRIADAVAASGLVAAAGPTRRAVVLILGSGGRDDVSTFTPAQARSYLAEVGVPLVVLRNGKRSDDGWPDGLPVRNMAFLAAALEDLRASLDRQCIMWLPNDLEPQTVAGMLPSDVMIAGRGIGHGTGSEEVWQRAELAAASDVADQREGGWAARGEVEVTASTVLVEATDLKGHPVTDLVAGDLTVTEDGDQAVVLGLERVEDDRQTQATEKAPEMPGAVTSPTDQPSPIVPVTVYADRRLGGSATVSAALEKLEARADWLVSLGPVDLVVAGDDVGTAFEGVRDADELRSALATAAQTAAGRPAVNLIRNRFIRDVRRLPTRSGSGIAGVAAGRMNVLVAARSAIAEESAAITQTLERLHRWAGEKAAKGPRLLLLIGTAFDEDPLDFYLPIVKSLEPMNESRARDEFRDPERAEMVANVGRDLAAAGWTVMPVAASTLNVGTSSMAAETTGSHKFAEFMSSSADPADMMLNEGWLQVDPVAAQEHVARASGGTVALGTAGIDSLVERSAGWYRLAYQVDRIPDGLAHELAISSSRSDVEVRCTRVLASGTSEDRARSRLLRLIEGEELGGGLDVTLGLSTPVAEDDGSQHLDVVVKVDFTPLRGLAIDGSDRQLRVSMAVDSGEDIPFVTHIPQSVASSVDRWEFSFPLVSAAGKLRVVVTVEDLATGLWGAAMQEVPG